MTHAASEQQKEVPKRSRTSNHLPRKNRVYTHHGLTERARYRERDNFNVHPKWKTGNEARGGFFEIQLLFGNTFMQQMDSKGGKLAEDGVYDCLCGIVGLDERDRVQRAHDVVLNCTGKCTSLYIATGT